MFLQDVLAESSDEVREMCSYKMCWLKVAMKRERCVPTRCVG